MGEGWTRQLTDRLLPMRKRDVLSFMRRAAPVDAGMPLRRIGGSGDGGYLVPDDLEGIAAVFSPGVDSTADFEREFADRGVPCFLADASVAGPPFAHPRFSFRPAFLGAQPGPSVITLDAWVGECAPAAGDLLLQMDIEGAEYGVLAAARRDTLRRFRMAVVEFHGLHRVWRRGNATAILRAFDALLEDFEVVHIHPNNCAMPRHRRGIALSPVCEFTFLRRDRLRGRSPARTFPHALDRTNVPGQPDPPLDPLWYTQEAP